jgi:hypothetical protein
VQLLVIRVKLSEERGKRVHPPFIINNNTLIMAPTTRRAACERTPPRERHVGEYDTIEKDRFFDAYDREHGVKSIPMIALESRTTEPTAKCWLRDRRENGREVSSTLLLVPGYWRWLLLV